MKSGCTPRICPARTSSSWARAPDEDTLRFAASLAAAYSKGAFAADKVPVDYTRRRFVKKPSGAKPGFVIYTNQRTIFARPCEKTE